MKKQEGREAQTNDELPLTAYHGVADRRLDRHDVSVSQREGPRFEGHGEVHVRPAISVGDVVHREENYGVNLHVPGPVLAVRDPVDDAAPHHALAANTPEELLPLEISVAEAVERRPVALERLYVVVDFAADSREASPSRRQIAAAFQLVGMVSSSAMVEVRRLRGDSPRRASRDDPDENPFAHGNQGGVIRRRDRMALTEVPMGRGPTPGTKTVAVVSIVAALALGIARDASAQSCDAGVFASAAQAPAGASVRITRSAPMLDVSGTEWALQVCFVLSQHGAAPAPVSATIDLRQPGQVVPFYRLGDAQLLSVGGLPSVCQVQPDELHLTLESAGPLPPNEISQECCVLARHPTTHTCELLPHEPDEVHVEIDTPGQPLYLTSVAVADRKGGVLGGGSGGGGGGGGTCGLTGIEFLGIPFALLAMRARSGRRAGGTS